jgi:glycosyltransferase involved in cell wall biosynthesis
MSRTASYVDIMIYAEGTYPYIRGGVSSWIHQIITNLSQYKFGICFIGSRKEDYETIRYELPDNLVHLETHYMFDDEQKEFFDIPQRSEEVITYIRELHKWFEISKNEALPEKLQSVSFYLDEASEAYFLHHPDVWSYITEKYEEHCPDIPFIDYFWALRNMHKPIWLIARIVKHLPKCGVHHAPSTGYAGFLGAMASYHQQTPFYISEHGIYTRERKIDLLNADWITYKKPLLLKTSEEFNYIKRMWINFFTKIGEFAYVRAEKIFSLFPQAMEIQKSFGAEPSKLEVLPNGVDVDRLNRLLANRDDTVPHVITLIGRVVTIKDIKTFIRAMKIVVEHISDAEGWIVGPLDEDEEYVEECYNMVSALGLENHVKFLGFQNIADILPKTGVQTLTSISEGMPLVILEGFAAGVPCVATDVGSCRNLIEGALNEEDIAIGHAGIVTGIANPVELADAYMRLLRDTALWKRMQKAGLERVEKFYRQEMFLQRYTYYYDKALKNGGNRL